MKLHRKVAAVAATAALGIVPALAMAAGPPSTVPADTPSTTPAPPAKAKAYGHFCQSESKQHVAGQHGTPFSKCVTDMAKLAAGSTKSPRTACKDESKKHVAGQHGTPFSQCVSAGAKLLKDDSAAS